ncbi:hypothetical protein [Streptomyces antimicrobicus]|uniref:Secreted protein n=1 Tax=Streptomyces antimicrobicus TaxID=2883108 RepID=A0ABS8B585_9ACTN|nr:hypothetical protein [Streptomyces antimicrobicus]MCB5179774.1 hypothetical protein [Streptomyces antimicrobicus]
MSTGTLLAIIIPSAVVLIALVVGLWMFFRHRRLQREFGTEYERVLDETGGTLAADRELRSRQQRHDDLDLRDLPADTRRQYAEAWTRVQEHFVDQPDEAVDEADALVTRVMRERGYPTEGYEQRVRDLSVEHGRTLEHYRSAHEVHERQTQGRATTEELRGAMVHYRALFDELLVPAGPAGRNDTRE